MKFTEMKCTYCGDNSEQISDNIEVFKCRYCGTTVLVDSAKMLANKYRELLRKGEEIDLSRYRKMLSDYVNERGIEESIVLQCIQKILLLLPEDFEAGYYKAFYHRRKDPYAYSHYLENRVTDREESKESVFAHALRYYEPRYYEAIESFACKNFENSTKYIDRLKKVKAEDEAAFDRYENIKRDIFLCHSSADKETVESLRVALEQEGIRTWASYQNMSWDTANYWNCITNAIEKCTFFAVVSSNSCMRRQDVLKELDIAERLSKPRLELRIDDSKSTLRFKEFFDGCQWIKINDYTSYQSALEAFIIKYYKMKRALQEEQNSLSASEIEAQAEKAIKETEQARKAAEEAAEQARKEAEQAEKARKEAETKASRQIEELKRQLEQERSKTFVQPKAVEEVDKERKKLSGKALEHYDKAIKGDAYAQSNLGYCYDIGKGVEKDYVKAVYWYTKAAEQGNTIAQTNLGICYEYGKGVKKDYVKAVYWYTKAAAQGKVRAQANLGYCYDIGQGVEKNYVKAVYWYTKAAEQDNTIAQSNLGICYEYGKGVEKDYVKAVYWYTKAAEQGNAMAQNNLGICYKNGQGVEKDYVKAVYWYTKAAEQGDASAQANLGYCYDIGQGVEKDYVKAVYWYAKAAEQRNAIAQNNLGLCYEYGRGVEKDYSKAVYWYTKAAEQGRASAQTYLGECYEQGKGVEKDKDKAIYWYTKAAEQGDAKAQNNLDKMKKISSYVEHAKKILNGSDILAKYKK